jgi:hypothetical protein
LSSPLMVMLGAISYSLYLWHWPLLMFSRYVQWDEHLWLPRLIAIQMAFFIAFFSWKYVEQGCRFLAYPIWLRQYGLRIMAAASAGLVLLGAGLWYANGIFGATAPFARLMTTSRMTVNGLQPACNYTSQDEDFPLLEPCLAGAATKDNRYQMLVWGDSQANQFVPAFIEVVRHHGITLRQMTKNGCPPLYVQDDQDNDSCNAFNDKVIAEIAHNKDLKYVVLAAHWQRHLDDYYHYMLGGKPVSLEVALQTTLDKLQAQGITPIVMGQIPSFERNADMELCFEFVTRRSDERHCLTKNTALDTEQAHAMLQSVHAQNLHVLYPEEVFCGKEVCRVHDVEGFYYHNASHLSFYGAKQLVPMIEKLWQSIDLGAVAKKK